MEGKSNSPSFYILNVGGLLLVLSIIGSTLRFAVVSVTLVSWLQTQWLAYTSALKRRHSARLAATAKKNRVQQRKQIAEISEAVGESVISLLDKRRQALMLTLDQEAEKKRQNYNQDIVKNITNDLAQFQEEERVKDEQRLAIRELRLSRREIEIQDRKKQIQALQQILDDREQRIKESERALQERLKLVEKREEKLKAEEKHYEEIHLKKEEIKIQRQSISQPARFTSSFDVILASPPSVNIAIILPADLIDFADDLQSNYFTCIGVTQKGARCRQSMISNASKSAALNRLTTMASPGPGDLAFFELEALRELADWMLCPRWHRDKLPQGDTIARRWYMQLSDARKRIKSLAVSSYETPPSAGSQKIFGSASTGNSSAPTSADSLNSVSMTYRSSDYSLPRDFQFGEEKNSSSLSGARGFETSVAKNLTPYFQSISQETKNGLGRRR